MKTVNVLIVIAMAFLSAGCSKQIDRLLGGGNDGPVTPKQYSYSEEFCNRYPSLDVCGGDQGGFRNQSVQP